MKRLLNWDSCGGGGWGGPPPGSIAPSPLPPWKRAVTVPEILQVTGDCTLNVNFSLIALNQTVPKAKDAANVVKPYFVTLPPGNYQGQSLLIFIPSSNIATTANFLVNGTIAGGSAGLLFNNTAFNAWLLWDGSGWSMFGGNAQPSASTPASYA